jgi:hypothetical protein
LRAPRALLTHATSPPVGAATISCGKGALRIFSIVTLVAFSIVSWALLTLADANRKKIMKTAGSFLIMHPLILIMEQ